MHDTAQNRHVSSFSRHAWCAAWLLASFLFTAACSAAPSQAAPKPLITSELGGRELTFLHKANEHTLVLIFLADLGKSKASSDRIRALGDLLLTTETKGLDQLNALALTKGLSFPPGQPGMVKRLQNRLASTDKNSFDSAWVSEVTGIIKAAIQNLSTGTELADAEIKSFANGALALARQELEVVEKVSAK